jgi:UDP-GlcNAc:undecaprenyl-phosphate GlcNAc-1-phosphate transferase
MAPPLQPPEDRPPDQAPPDEPATAPGPRGLHRFKRVLPLVVMVIVLVGAGVIWRNLVGWLSTQDPVRTVDVIVVPAGEIDTRLPKALNHLDKGKAKQIWVVSSSAGPVLKEPEAISAYGRGQHHGDDIDVLKKRSRSLVRDARLISAHLRREERKSGRRLQLAVVTSPLEISRTRLVFERETGRDVRVWRDGERFERKWQSLVQESARVLTTLAVLGAGNELRPGKVPWSLPARALFGGFLAALLAGALCRPIARRLGFVSVPRLLRAHSTPTPMFGGLALLAGLAGGVVAAGGVRLGAIGAAAAAGVVVISLVGLIDDIAGLGAGVRIVWATLAGAVAWLLGLRAIVFPGDGIADVGNAVLTVLWFVAVNVAVNWLDNLDGVTAGVGAASAGAIAVAAALGGQFVVAVAAAAVAGACLGYLVHNVAPARLFMGDMGASGLGFALAALALALTPRARPPLSIAAAVIALGVPIFDTVLVVISRMRSGRSPGVGGTDHTAHRLLGRGLSVRQAAAFLWLSQAALGVLAVVVARSRWGMGWAVVALVTVAGLVSLATFLRMAPWTPPWQLEASEQVVQAVHRAMRALRGLEEAVGDEAWRLSDPRAARSTQETLRRLERVRSLLESGPSGGQSAPSPDPGPPPA